MKKYILPILLLVTLLGYQNCSDVSFQTVQNLSSQSCSAVLETTNKDLRIIFMVDDSGSTLDTDPMKKYRALAIQEFLKKYGNKTNFSYGFGEFASSSASFYNVQSQAFINAGSSTAGVIGTSANLSTALNVYLAQQTNKDANTPYRDAFTALRSAIMNDISQTNSLAQKPNYAIVFMSDGQPNPGLRNDELIGIVNDLKNTVLNSSRLASVSTVYFGPAADNNAKKNLIDMAQAGNGQFVDTNQSSDLTIESVVTVPGEICSDGNPEDDGV